MQDNAKVIGIPFEKGHPGFKPKGSVGIGTRVRNECLKRFGKDYIKLLYQWKVGTKLEQRQFADHLAAMLPKNTEVSGTDGKDLIPDLKLIFPTHDKPTE